MWIAREAQDGRRLRKGYVCAMKFSRKSPLTLEMQLISRLPLIGYHRLAIPPLTSGWLSAPAGPWASGARSGGITIMGNGQRLPKTFVALLKTTQPSIHMEGTCG